MSQHQRQPTSKTITDLAAIAYSFAIFVSLLIFHYWVASARDTYVFLNSDKWQYWAIYVSLLALVICGVNAIAKWFLKRQTQGWLDTWGERVPMLRFVLLVGMSVIMLLLWSQSG